MKVRRAAGILMLVLIIVPLIPLALINVVSSSAAQTYQESSSSSPPVSVSGTYSDKEIEHTTKEIVINETNVELSGGMVLAPHLWNWYFNGIDGYIVMQEPTTIFKTGTITVELRDKMVRMGYSPLGPTDTANGWWFNHIIKFQYSWWIFSISEEHCLTFEPVCAASIFRAGNGTITGVTQPPLFSADGYWNRIWVYHNDTAIYNGTYVTAISYAKLENGTIVTASKGHASYTLGGITVDKIALGSGVTTTAAAEGYRKPAVLLSYVKIYWNKSLKELIDPTFFNGTTYFDLANHQGYGIPSSGLYRVPSDKVWLWVINNVYQDTYIHLEWFPKGSTIDFINSSNGVLVKRVTVNSNNMTVSLPAGKYNIVAHVYRTTISIHVFHALVDTAEIDINNAGSELVNYPLKLVFTSANFSQWSELSTSNIYFTDIDGNPLPYFIQTLDTTNQLLIAWVNVTLPTGTTSIFMHYGNANPYSTYNDPWKVYIVHEDWSENVSNTGSGPTNYQITTYWNNTVTDATTDAAWTTTINTTMAYLYVKDTVLGDGADINYLVSLRNIRIPCVAYVDVLPTAYSASSSWNIGFRVGAGQTPGAWVAFASWFPGDRVVTNNGTTQVYNQYSFLPPAGVFTKVKLYLTKTNLFVYYYNTTLAQWVYIGNVTLNFDPTQYQLKFVISSHAWAGASQSIYINPTTMVYWDPTTSLSYSTNNGGHITVIYPNYLEPGPINTFNVTIRKVLSPSVTAYNSTYNEVTVSYTGLSDLDFELSTYYDPIAYFNPTGNYTYYPYGYNVTMTGGVWNQSGYSVSGVPIKYAVGMANAHNVIETNLTVGTKVSTSGNVDAGAVIAPHLYDWYFDGTGYILIPYDPWLDLHYQPQTLIGRVRITGYPSLWTPLTFIQAYAYGLYYNNGLNLLRAHTNNGTQTFYSDVLWSNDYEWHVFAQTFNPSNIYPSIVLDGKEMVVSTSASAAISQTKLGILIGRGWTTTQSLWLQGYVSYEFLFALNLSNDTITSITSTYTVNSQYLRVLMDPTFFNGSVYFDLVNSSVIGTPYGGVSRVPTTNPWLWIANNIYNDGYVHFRFFPNGTTIKIYDDNNILIKKFTISGAPNGAGLVSDFKVMLPSGNYKIVAYIPSGNILAPHLYDWYLDGTGYISLPTLPTFFTPEATVESYVKINESTGQTENIFRAQSMWVDGWTNNVVWPQIRVYMYFNATWKSIAVGTASDFNNWGSIGLAYISGSGGIFSGYLNGNVVGSITGYLNITGNPQVYAAIGSENGVYYFKGWISYLKYYDRYNPDIFLKNSLNITNGTIMIFDPSFYNGTDYFELVNSSIVGVPHGGVSRVPANKTWVWDVQLYEYGKAVQLRWFPKGSLVQFIDPNTGEVVKQVIVTSNSDTVNVPAGSYLVKVYVGFNYASGTLTTDASGQIYISAVTPNNDSLIFVQVDSNGYYLGLKTLKLYVTSIKYDVTVPDNVTRDQPFNYSVNAYLTVNHMSLIKITINSTLFYGTSGSGTYTYNESGHHQFVLYLTGVRDAVNVSYTFTKTIFVGGHVNWVLTLTPNYIPYPLNYTFTATLDVKYDNGEEVTVPVSVNVTRLDTKVLVFTNTSKPAITMNLTAVWDLDVTARMTDLDGRVYTFNRIIYAAIPHQSFSIIVKGTGYVFTLNTTIKHVFLTQEPTKYNQTIIFYDFFNFTIEVYRDYVLVLDQNATNPMYFNVPSGYEADVYFDMIGKKIVMYIYLPGAVRPGSITVINANPLVTSAPNLGLPAPNNSLFSGYGVVGSLLSTAMIMGVGIGFARAEKDPVVGIAIAAAIMVPVSLLIGNQTAYYISLAILVVSLGYKVMRWLTS